MDQASDDVKEMKMALVVRTDLSMTKGKIGAQCGHATIGAYRMNEKQAAQDELTEAILCRWMMSNDKLKFRRSGGPFEVYQVKSEEALREVKNLASRESVPHYLTRDAGKTQIAKGTVTVCSIGPLPSDQLKRFVADLKLLN